MIAQLYIAPNTERPAYMKKTLLAPRDLGFIRIGQIRDKTKVVPHSVSRPRPRPVSIVVSAQYIQATGPLVFWYTNKKAKIMAKTPLLRPLSSKTATKA